MIDFIVSMGIGLLWFGLIYWWFKPDEELRGHVFKVFLLGMLICVPVGYFNTFWMTSLVPWVFTTMAGGSQAEPSWFRTALLFLLIAPIEEIVKFFIVRSESYRLKAFDTVQEGVMLATFSALGFATFENFHYMQQHGFAVIFLRGWLCPIAHMLFSATFGYYLGLAKTRAYRSQPIIAEGLILASIMHGCYNGSTGLGRTVTVGLVVAYFFYYLIMLRGERQRPLLSIVAPDLTDVVGSGAPGGALKRPRLPIKRDGATTKLIEQILDEAKQPQEQRRLDAIKKVRGLADQRVYEMLKQLQHDPVMSVRLAAHKAAKPLELRLEKLYEQAVQGLEEL